MLHPGVTVVFDPPGWRVVLTWAAAVALSWEFAALIGWIFRQRRGAAGAGICAAALLAGPLVAPAAAIHAAMVAAPAGGRLSRTLATASARATLLYALAAAIVFSRATGSIAAISVCAVFWTFRAYRRTTSPLRPPAKALLVALRLAMLALVLLWAAGPTLEYQQRRKVRGVVLIGVDASASMRRRDVPADHRQGAGELIPRIEAVRRALRESGGQLRAIAARADLEMFSFAASARPGGQFAAGREASFLRGLKADGKATALGDAAAGAFEPHVAAGRDVKAIVLISDGCNNTSATISPDKLAAIMGSRGVPVHTVGVGSETVTGELRTLNVRRLSAPREVDAFRRLPISASVEAMGLDGRDVRVTCTFGHEEVASEVFSVAGVRQSKTFSFVHVPLGRGFHRLSVSAEVVGERPGGLGGQPRASRLIHVRDRELRVLYVEGKLRYESKYIVQALTAARRFSVDRRILLDRRGAGRRRLGDSLQDYLAYHAILIGDVPAERFGERQLEIMRELVADYGKGLCMIGGSRSFGRGGWAGTPLADVLPVDMRLSAGQIESPIRVTPTDEGLSSEIMSIGNTGKGSQVAEAWKKLRALPGANRLGGLKPAARVLATTADGLPLIVAQRYGKGRSLAVAFDTTWRWVLSRRDTAELQKRFWRQVALYLSAPKGNAWIVTDRTSYDLDRLKRRAETIDVRAGVEDSAGRPVVAGDVDVRLISPGGRATPVALALGENMRKGRLPPPAEAGIYRLRIAAEVGGRRLAAEHQFEVVRRDLEALEPLANLELLRRMAAASKGRYAELQDMRGLLERLRLAAEPRSVAVVSRKNLSAMLRWPIVVVLMTLLCIEWSIRKRKGLV